jgi:hypothetical protein
VKIGRGKMVPDHHYAECDSACWHVRISSVAEKKNKGSENGTIFKGIPDRGGALKQIKQKEDWAY